MTQDFVAILLRLVKICIRLLSRRSCMMFFFKFANKPCVCVFLSMHKPAYIMTLKSRFNSISGRIFGAQWPSGPNPVPDVVCSQISEHCLPSLIRHTCTDDDGFTRDDRLAD